MRSSRLHLAVAVTLLTGATIHGQTAATGRIDGTIVDTTSSVLPGVTVAIIANGESQFTVTDEMGRYAFEKIGSATYALTATLPGFRNQQLEGVVVTADTTTTVDLTLNVGCLEEVHTVGDTSLNQLLTSDVVVYLRVTEHGLDRFIESRDLCDTANEASATIRIAPGPSADHYYPRNSASITWSTGDIGAKGKWWSMASRWKATTSAGHSRRNSLSPSTRIPMSSS